MKKILYCLFLSIFCINQTQANTLKITNVTPGQISIILQTNTQTITQIVPANLNPILNDVNEPDPNPTIMNFDNNPIEKITITRFSPNMPQIIYYDGQNTPDSHQKPGGIQNLNFNTRDNNMLVWNNYTEINNATYSLNDLDSYTTRANKLKNDLSSTNIDIIQKQLNDLSNSINLVKESDMGFQLSMQTTSIQIIIDDITSNIKIMETLNSDLKTIDDLQKDLSIGDNNLTGTNLPYQPANDSVERSKQTLTALQYGFKNLNQSNLTKNVCDQIEIVKSAMRSLEEAMNIMKSAKDAINYEILTNIAANLQTVQNT